MSMIIPDEATIEIIRSVFSDKNVTIEDKKRIKIRTQDGKDCVTVYLYPDFIYISSIEKCGNISGSELLKMFDTLAERMSNIKYIELTDVSQIKICGKPISLYILKILTTGQSWYNKHGYFSKHHPAEIGHNESIINKPYEEFINIVYKEEEEERNKGIRLFPDTGKTVKDYFNYVLSDIKDKSCDPITIEKCTWLSNFIDNIENSEILQYDGKVRKMVIREESGKGGAKTKRSNKSKKSKSKRSKTKKRKRSKTKKRKRSKKY
jgi:hypothetical protein